MNNEPVAWAVWEGNPHDVFLYKEEADELCRLKGGDAKSVPLYTHPAKELHLSLQKSKETGELLAVTYTDDEHRIVEVLWKKPPEKALTDEEINVVAILQDAEIVPVGHEIWKTSEEFNKYKRIVLATAKALRKAQE